VTIEEPLEFSIAFGAHSSREIKNLAVTMRTPGNDFELVLGFLYSEGIIKNKSDVQAITRMDNLEDSSNIENTVLVELDETLGVDPQKIRNNRFFEPCLAAYKNNKMHSVKQEGCTPLHCLINRDLS